MSKPSEIDALVEEAAELAADGNIRSVAQDLVRGLPDHFLRRLAVAFIVDRVKQRDRRLALVVEREAMRAEIMQEMTTSAAPAGRKWRTQPTLSREALDEISRNATLNMMARMNVIVADYTESLRLEWTAELLDSQFSLSDGTSVTWADATVAQHRERVSMFMANVAANAEGAARHKKAIEALELTGATSLRQVLAAA